MPFLLNPASGKAFQPNIDSKPIDSFALAANASGFLQVVVSKATAPDSEATDFSSAVASDTTLGLLAHPALRGSISGRFPQVCCCNGPDSVTRRRSFTRAMRAS